MGKHKAVPAADIYTAKVEALLALAKDFTEADFLALACAAADQAGADTRTTDTIHALVATDMELNAEARERWAEDSGRDRQRAQAEIDAARAEDFGEASR